MFRFSNHRIWRAFVKVLPLILLSISVVFAGSIFGYHYLPLNAHSNQIELDAIRALAAWDGTHYIRIADNGYSFDPERESNVVFFPAFPLLGRVVAHVTRV